MLRSKRKTWLYTEVGQQVNAVENGQTSRLAFVGILVEAAKGVDLVVADVGDGRVHQARRPCANGGDDLRPIAFAIAFALFRRTGRHEKGVVGRGC